MIDPMTIGLVVLGLGGPAAVAGGLIKYGKLNQKVVNNEIKINDLETEFITHTKTDLNSFELLRTDLNKYQIEVIDRLARIEQELKN